MAACLPSEKDHLNLDSLHTHSADSLNSDTSSSHGSGHEHILDTALDDKPYDPGLVHDQEPKPNTQDDGFFFTDDELVELELLRDQEIDSLVDAGLLFKEDRWNDECRQGFTLSFPEMTIRIFTGDFYPVKALRYEVKNINLPRVVVDQLRVALRGIHKIDARANTFKNGASGTQMNPAALNSRWEHFTSPLRLLTISNITERIPHTGGIRSIYSRLTTGCL